MHNVPVIRVAAHRGDRPGLVEYVTTRTRAAARYRRRLAVLRCQRRADGARSQISSLLGGWLSQPPAVPFRCGWPPARNLASLVRHIPLVQQLSRRANLAGSGAVIATTWAANLKQVALEERVMRNQFTRSSASSPRRACTWPGHFLQSFGQRCRPFLLRMSSLARYAAG